MPGGNSERAEDRVKRALVDLGTDSASAPDVPATVTARISAALRAAPPSPAHTTNAAFPQSRLRVLALVIGICAAVAAVVVGIAILLHSAPAARFPSGPTAEKITVSRAPADTPNSVVTPP